MNIITIPISPGELIDKITILEIKSERMTDPDKIANVRTELELLRDTWRASAFADRDIASLQDALKSINEKLWVIEDDIRDCERQGDFGPTFVDLARSVYFSNDERAALKREINTRLGSTIVEEKSYADYSRDND